MNWDTFGKLLKHEGLVQDAALPPRQYSTVPWHLQGASIFGAWLAASMLLSFMGGILYQIWESAPMRVLLGMVLCGVAWWLVRTPPAATAATTVVVAPPGATKDFSPEPQPAASAPPAKATVRNVRGESSFRSQFGLALSLAGLASMLSTVVDTRLPHTLQALIVFGVAGVLWWLNPESIHRTLMAWLMVVALAVAMMINRLEPAVTLVFAAATCVLWLTQSRWAVAGHATLIAPLATACAGALILLQAPDLVPREVLAGGPIALRPHATAWMRVAILAAALAASGVWIARNAGLQRSQPSRLTAPAIVIGAIVLAASAWKVPGITACVLVWVLGVAAGRSQMRWFGLAGLLVYLTWLYYSVGITLMDKGIALLASGVVLVVMKVLLTRLWADEKAVGAA